MNPLKLLPSRFLICVIATLSLMTGMSQQAVAANYISDDVYTFYHAAPVISTASADEFEAVPPLPY